jgi:hypothetical protein
MTTYGKEEVLAKLSIYAIGSTKREREKNMRI